MDSGMVINKTDGTPTESGTSPVAAVTHNPNQVADAAKENRIPFAWMTKECRIYKEEYKDCKSIKGRFHQYFLGEWQECGQWKEDYDNCLKWHDEKDQEAFQKVIDSEKERVRQRLQAHYANDVWEKRESPPETWNSELPDFIKKEYENSYLKLKADEIKKGEIDMDDIYADGKMLRRGCTIL